jgi:hypothetical protein
LNRLLTFRQAAALLDYLQDLGISDCYTSPFLMARPGSLHGYDVTDPTRLNPEIGDEQDFDDFTAQLQQRGMGLIADVVANHMCVTHPSNTWWWDDRAVQLARIMHEEWNATELWMERSTIATSGRICLDCMTDFEVVSPIERRIVTRSDTPRPWSATSFLLGWKKWEIYPL